MEISRKLYITIQGTCGTLLTSEDEEDEAAATQKKIALFPFRLVNYTAPFLIHTEISYLCTCRDGGTPSSPPF